MPNFKTPIEEIFFRSSKIGLLAGGLIRHGLTEKQREEMDKLELSKITPIGLTEKQQKDLDLWNSKIEEGKTLTSSQMEKRDDYKRRLKEPKVLTPAQDTKLQELKERNAKPPELSQGAKTFVKEVWLLNEKGFKEEVTDKKLRKGLQGEEDAINLISFVDGIFYTKNEERIYKGNISGECDVVTEFKNMQIEEGSEETIDAIVVDDLKCSWNPRTFMNASLTTIYEWQGRSYLHLYNGDIFRLRHTLINCPPDVFKEEYSKFCFQKEIVDDTLEEYKPLIIQFIKNNIYDFNSFSRSSKYYPDIITSIVKELGSEEFNYTEEERVKTFQFVRDTELEAILLDSVKLAVEYYKTITLNMIEDE